jgi:hypothetical protein
MDYKISYTTKQDLIKLNDFLQEKFSNRNKRYIHISAESYFNFADPIIGDSSLDQWKNISFSIKEDDALRGYIRYSIDRECNYVSNILIFSLWEKPHPSFLRSVLKTVQIIFDEFKVEKICFTTTGQEQKRIYDTFIKRYGGRYVGYREKHCKLADGNLYDSHMWEVKRSEFKGV